MRSKALLAVVTSALMVAGGVVVAPSAQAKTKTKVFTNDAGITINDDAEATPYPSEIEVAGFKKGKIKKVTATIHGLTHTAPNFDVDVLLVGPTGHQTVLMSDIGIFGAASDVDLTFADGAAEKMTTAAASGTFKPTDNSPGINSEFPDSTPLVTDSLGVFKKTDPNGTWKLYVIDDFADDAGSIAGWSLRITATVK